MEEIKEIKEKMTKEELKQQFYKYIKDHEDYFDPREPWTERIILQIWLDCAEPREKRIAELERQLEISETNADTYYDELTKLQEQLVKTTQIGMTCSNCKWSQYDEDEMCYCCSNKDKWELKLRR